MSKRKDITGQTFNYLTAIKWIYKKNNKNYWLCKCKCGNYTEVQINNLTNGAVKSCGCLVAENNKKIHFKDLTNQKFGKLTALYSIYQNNQIYWHCKCECGNEIDVVRRSLTSGNTKSCGCILSNGERIISLLLNKYNITYETQKQFPDCKFGDYINSNAKFDFYVNNQYLIEFDGSQHFKANYSKSQAWNTQENLIKTQYRDQYKNEYCKLHHIPLIRIPYTHLADLCIDDLLLSTSKYICVP